MTKNNAALLDKIIVIKGNHDNRRDLERLVENNIISSWFDQVHVKDHHKEVK